MMFSGRRSAVLSDGRHYACAGRFPAAARLTHNTGSPAANLMTLPITVRRSPIHGTGVFATRTIKSGTEVIEYKGKLITHKYADKHYGDGGETGHTFLFTLNDDYIIDANVDGSDARWINYSCDPNCQAVLHEDGKGRTKKDQVIIEAIRDIKRGEELTYDYGITLEVRQTARLKKIWECRCGSPKCIGTMLKPKSRAKA
jgi:SET domain-containing protein